MQLAAGGGDEDDGGATASGELEGELADGTLGPGAGGDRPGVEEGGGEVVEPVVDPIAPNRMFEKVTDASARKERDGWYGAMIVQCSDTSSLRSYNDSGMLQPLAPLSPGYLTGTRYLLLATCYLLVATCYLLHVLATCYLLLTTYYLQLMTTYYLLLATFSKLPDEKRHNTH